MNAGILLLLAYWVIFTARRHFTPKVSAAIKAETYNVNVAKGPNSAQRHTRRLACWTVAKWALRVAGWAENILVVLAVAWLVYLIGAVLTGTVVVFGYPVY